MVSRFAGVLQYALFEDATKLLPEGGVLFLIIGRQVGQHAENFLGRIGAHGVNQAIVLENFTRHIQGQIIGVNDAAHEAQVAWHELFRVIHDEDAAHIELDAVRLLATPQVKGGTCRNVEQQDIFVRAFHAAMDVG